MGFNFKLFYSENKKTVEKEDDIKAKYEYISFFLKILSSVFEILSSVFEILSSVLRLRIG